MPKSYLPTFVSFLGIFSGFFAIKYAIYGQYHIVFILLLCMGLFDYLDGFLARKMNVISTFGMQIDSLCDVFAFGVVPAICSYLWVLSDFRTAGVLTSAIIICALIFRLARYNALKSDNISHYKNIDLNKYFTGIPAPMFGFLILLPISFFTVLENLMCSQYFDIDLCVYSIAYLSEFQIFKICTIVYYLIISYLAISTIPILSPKHIKLSKFSWIIITAVCISIYIYYGVHIFVLLVGLIMLIYIFSSLFIKSNKIIDDIKI